MSMQGESIQDRRFRERVEQLTGERGDKSARAVTLRELEAALRRIAALEQPNATAGADRTGQESSRVNVSVDANFSPFIASAASALATPMTSEDLEAAPTMEDFNKLRADVEQTRAGNQALLRLIRRATAVIEEILRQTR